MIQLSNETLLAIQYGLSYLFCIALCFAGPILSIIGTILTSIGDYLFNCGKDKTKAASIYNIIVCHMRCSHDVWHIFNCSSNIRFDLHHMGIQCRSDVSYGRLVR